MNKISFNSMFTLSNFTDIDIICGYLLLSLNFLMAQSFENYTKLTIILKLNLKIQEK